MKILSVNIDYLRRASKSFIPLFFIILLTFPIPALSWTLELKRAIFQFYQGTASTKQINLLRQNNNIINNMASTGHIRNDIYQKIQKDFSIFNENVAQKVASKNDLILKTQTSIKAPSPGTDSDYITSSNSGKMTPEQIKNTILDYNNEMNKKFGTKNVNYAKKLNTDFMANPEQMTDKGFKEVSKLNNDAYKRRASARYEAKVREPGKKVSIFEAIEYKKDMNDLISKKSSEIKQIKEELLETIKNDPYEMETKIDNLRAKLQIRMQQQAKYIQRLNNTVMQTAKKFGIEIKPEFSNISKNAADRSMEPKKGLTTEQLAQDKRIKSSASNTLKEHLVQQSKSSSIKTNIEASKNILLEAGDIPNRKLLITDAAEQLSQLSPNKQGEILQDVRQRLGDKAANELLSETKKVSAGKRKPTMKANVKESVSRYMQASVIAALANDVRTWAKGEKSNLELAEDGLNMVSMGYYSIGKNLSGWKQTNDLVYQAYESNKQARISKIAIDLRKTGVVPLQEIKSIIMDMENNKEDSLDKTIAELRQKGINYTKPKHIKMDNISDTTWKEYFKGVGSRSLGMGWGILSSPVKLAWGTGKDIGELIMIDSDIYKQHRTIKDSELQILEMLNKINSQKFIKRLISMGASENEAKDAILSWKAGKPDGLKKVRKLRKKLVISKQIQKRDVYIRLFALINGERTVHAINNGIIHLKNETANISAHKMKQPGVYKIVDIKPGKYTLSIKAEGYKTGSSLLSLDPIVPKAEQNIKPQLMIKTLYLVPEPVQIAIEVVDDQGNILSDADVALHGSKWNSSKQYSIDSSGKIIFKDVPPGTYQVSAAAQGYHSLTDGSKIKINPSNAKNIILKHITLIPYLSTLKVTITDILGQPVQDVKVLLNKNTGMTDSKGEFIFTSVRPGTGLKVSAKKEGYPSVTVPIDVVPTQENEAFTLKITLQGGIPLTVKVIDEESGKILEGATVQLSYADEYATLTSNEKGLAKFDSLAPAYIYISATLPGYQPVSRVEKDLRFAKSGEMQTAVIKLTEGMKITAYIKDLDGVLLLMGEIAMDDGSFLSAPTGSRVFTPVKEGKHIFRGRAKEFAEAIILYEAKPKEKSSDKVSLKLLPGGTITVEVRNEKGILLRGQPARITLFKDGKLFKTGTGPIRMFTNLEPGIYSAKADSKAYTGAVSRKIKYTGDPQAFHDTLKVTLMPKIELSSIFVSVIARDNKGNPSQRSANIKVTGASGSFIEHDMVGKFSDLMPGKYTVTASVKGFKSKTKTVRIPADKPGKIYTLSFDLSQDKPDSTKTVSTLNCCHKNTEKCTTDNILAVLKYCRELCRGKPNNANCFRTCRQNTDCDDQETQPWTPPPATSTVRKIPDNNRNRQNSNEPELNPQLKALQQKYKQLGEKLKSAKDGKDAAKVRWEMILISNRINRLLIHINESTTPMQAF